MPKDSTSKVTLEQLLDLKRAEKPADEFWDGFQKEFRQRQLQTLIEKESAWSRIPRQIFARSSLLLPLSGAAVAVFLMVINFRGSAPLHNEYYETATLIQASPQTFVAEVAVEFHAAEPVEESVDIAPDSAISSSASFVMDLIPNEEQESLSYTREFPTSTIRSETRAVSALVSYTIARNNPTFGMTARPRTIGF